MGEVKYLSYSGKDIEKKYGLSKDEVVDIAIDNIDYRDPEELVDELEAYSETMGCTPYDYWINVFDFTFDGWVKPIVKKY